MEGQPIGDTLWYIWFAVLIAFVAVLFIAKLKFNEIFKKREERRRMLSYSKMQLSPTEDGSTRGVKVKRVEEK